MFQHGNMLLITVFLLTLLTLSSSVNLKLSAVGDDDDNINISLNPQDDGISLSITKGTGKAMKLQGTIGRGYNFSDTDCVGSSLPCQLGDISLTVQLKPEGFMVTWTSDNLEATFRDCFDLGDMNWYGGPERYNQVWPLEKMDIDENLAYVIRKSDNFAVAERYWLNSNGVYVFVDDKVPLFVGQSAEQKTVCFVAKAVNPYVNRERVLLQYDIVIKNDPKEAHLNAVNNFLGKPTGHPNEAMIKEPTWTTWPKYKKYINETLVADFFNSVRIKGYKGQIEIDEDWETCFGTHVFKPDLFSNITGLVQDIKDAGFRATLWINPFVNNDCEELSSEGSEKGYFVRNLNGNTTAIWWESTDANQIDFTNADAAKWFSDKIAALQADPGLDGFKFDAGETDYAIPPSQYDNVDQEEVPNILTKRYVETCSQFGDLIEVRSAWRTQNYPFFVRMIDKDSVWGVDDGLYSLVTTLLQMNMNGYGMVLPDMVGGNGYRQQPTSELIVRWTQANALMPAIQFGYLPWDYPSDEFDIEAITKKFVQLHQDYYDYIIQAMQASIDTGSPVNPPIWWIDPTDEVALATDDEFMVGESLLVAPILEEGSVMRDVYLPSGRWIDKNSGKVYVAPITLVNYSAPIDVLPFFWKVQ